jgi:predicted HTH transcriptional regulator
MDWIRFFLLCLVTQKEALARKIRRERLMTTLSRLDEQILELTRQHGRLTLSEAVATTKANRNTLKLHLRNLVEAGRLTLQGRGRGSWYELG